MNEFGESPAFYIEPADHVEGEPYPEDFYERLYEVLGAAGFYVEPV